MLSVASRVQPPRLSFRVCNSLCTCCVLSLQIGYPRCCVQLPFLVYVNVALSLLGISVCLDASESAVHSVHADGPPPCVLYVVVLCVLRLMDRLSHMST